VNDELFTAGVGRYARERAEAALSKIAAVNAEIQGSRHEAIADALVEARTALRAAAKPSEVVSRAYQPPPPTPMRGPRAGRKR
jgi:hypothetical protein